jgi:hypothetical protein
VAAKSIAAIPAEAIPFIGVAVLIADTGYELYAACETVWELDQLYSDLGVADEPTDDVMHSVCDPELPDAGRHISAQIMILCFNTIDGKPTSEYLKWRKSSRCLTYQCRIRLWKG